MEPLKPGVIGPKKKITLHAATDIEVEEPSFLWFPYIPDGMLTFIEGDPGIGKSWMLIKMAADLSNGHAMPGVSKTKYPPSNVLMFTGEEPLGIMRGRLNSLGADPSRVFLSDSIFTIDKPGLTDMGYFINEHRPKMVVLDPFQSFIPGDADMNSAKDMQQSLQPLSKLAGEVGTAIVVIRHLRKSGGQNAKHSGIGSIALTGIVRSVLQMSQTKGGNHVMKHVKHNYSDRGDTLTYEFGKGKFEWKGTWENDSSELPSISKGANKKVVAAQAWLSLHLATGMQPAVDVLREGNDAGFNNKILSEAKKTVASSVKKGNIWYWERKMGATGEHTPSAHVKMQRTPEDDALIEAALARKAENQ